jgi:hypothetical protein
MTASKEIAFWQAFAKAYAKNKKPDKQKRPK